MFRPVDSVALLRVRIHLHEAGFDHHLLSSACRLPVRNSLIFSRFDFVSR
jgi:hypothetical protein